MTARWFALASALAAAWTLGAQMGPDSNVDLSNPDVAAIVQMAKAFCDAWKRADLVSMMDAYSADAIKMSPGSPNRGKEDLERSYADLLSKYNVEVEVKIEEVTVVSSSTAFDRARYTVIATPKTGGKPLVSSGRLLEVLRKENGKWKSLRAMNILDEPQS
jgi:uncharacterized protein (TIGR02246 family)